MRVFIGLLLFSLAGNAYSIPCNKHPIYCKIKQLRPKMPNQQAMQLSNIFHINAKKYNGDPILAVAIAMQETGLRSKQRHQKVIQFATECLKDQCNETWQVIQGVSDVCMFQIHIGTILNYKINPVKLKNDLNYCVSWHFKLMKEKRKLCSSLGNASWSCYHSKTERIRKIYFKLVSEYL
jgi:hypothetical protein